MRYDKIVLKIYDMKGNLCMNMNIKSNYYVSPLLRAKDYLDELEEQDFSNIRAALRKMGTFLSERGISLPAKDVKRQPRIEIKGVDSNGKERLLQQEIKEKLGIVNGKYFPAKNGN